ncbi:putative galacturonosyltransferase 6-like [Dorcoceras hygrometricum]|uniref:Hexosyltransferase n=1 Tax=Dorcoceras hygrometricum TaxID=472368 RepID=A0A2Z7BGI2_9LAMI|nr:putative galacturonosyltransferase 6-like [Dorcoceras hygrometricum]
MKAMESTLLKASRRYPDCTAEMESSLAMSYNVEEQIRTHQTRETFLKELGGRTVPIPLHCLSMRLTAEYYALKPEEREFPNKRKRQDPDLYHFVVLSDNILASSVVVNSTVSTAKEPEKIVFHVVTNSANFPSMSMWFLSNPPSKATVHVEIADLRLLSGKLSGNTKKEISADPRDISELNHLLFYLPYIFPHLNKVVLLDHDVVVRKDLTPLWTMGIQGRVNGAVSTCDDERPPLFRNMDMFINFTDPIIADRFDALVCPWAFGMNVFDLQEWRHQNLTKVYHKYLRLGKDRPLWKVGGILPIGLITFYGRTYDIDKKWHLLGLGYDSGVRQEVIEKAAVIHYNGNMKPWLAFGLEKYRHYWSKHVKYEHPFLQSCNIHDHYYKFRI